MGIVILAITLVLGEVSMRIYHHFHPLFIFYDDSYNRFRGKPFARDWDFKLNSRGFKDVEFPERKGSGYRIVALGDSFAFGVVPYQFNYLTLLESRMQQDSPGIEVLNMGVPGTGPREYLSILVREGLALQPDMVLVSFFIGNDLIESRGKPEPRKWYSYSYLASLFHYLIQIRPQYEGKIFHKGASYCDMCPHIEPTRYLQIEKARAQIMLAGNKMLAEMVSGAADALREMAEICRKKGIKFVVVLIPDEVQVNRELQSEVRKQLGVTAKNAWANSRPNDMLTARLREMDVGVLDLLPVFSKESAARPLYRVRDTHWNIPGNALAAESIQAFIRSQVRR